MTESFGNLYDQMLQRIENQLNYTKNILDGFKSLYTKETDPDKKRSIQRNIDYEQGYKAGIDAAKHILDSYYDRIW